MKKVSFVIPCYRSEHTLPHVVKEIREKMQELTQYEYDIFLVNDASPDNTMGTIRDLCDKYDNIKGIGFARNFGQHAALMAGLRHSDGDYVVCLDDDGQTPADEVDKLLGKLEEGFDAVYASYEHKQHSAFRNMGSKVNELMNNLVVLSVASDDRVSLFFLFADSLLGVLTLVFLFLSKLFWFLLVEKLLKCRLLSFERLYLGIDRNESFATSSFSVVQNLLD